MSSYITLQVLLDSMLKATVLLVCAILAALFLRRSSAARRHLLWSATLCAVILIPALSVLLPQWQVLPGWFAIASPARPASLPQHGLDEAQTAKLPPAAIEWLSGNSPQTIDPPHKAVAVPVPARIQTVTVGSLKWRLMTWTWRDWLCLTWAAGVIACLAPLFIGTLAIWRIRTRTLQSKISNLKSGIEFPILLSLRCHMPMACGIFRPAIILPADADQWPAQRLHAVLAHEQAHLRRRDCLWQMLGQLARALYWLNPLVWMAYHRLLAESERACDDTVLDRSKASDYAEHLLSIATSGRSDTFLAAAAIAMAAPNRLEGRLLSILDATRSRRGVTFIAGAVLLLVLAGLAVPLAMLRAAQPTPRAASTQATVGTLPAMQCREVNKTLGDVGPQDDLSTPEGAWAAVSKAIRDEDHRRLSDLTWPASTAEASRRVWDRLKQEDPDGVASLKQAIANSTLLEVWTDRNDLAFTISLLTFPEGKDRGRGGYSVRTFARTEWTWVNLGEAVFKTIEDARQEANRRQAYARTHPREELPWRGNVTIMPMASRSVPERLDIPASDELTLSKPPQSQPAEAAPSSPVGYSGRRIPDNEIITLTLSEQLDLAGLKVTSLDEGRAPVIRWTVEGAKPDYLGIMVVPTDRPDIQNIQSPRFWQMMNDPKQQAWCVMGLPGDTAVVQYGQKWPDVKNLAEWHPADKLKTGYYLLMVMGYKGEFRQGEGRQPILRGGAVLRVGNPPEMPKLDTSKLTPEQMMPRLKEWVEGFFQSNYRDITARKTIEWGDATKEPNGNWSIRYKYEATIWNKDQIIQDKVFTFTPEGGFVAVKDAAVKPAAATQPRSYHFVRIAYDIQDHVLFDGKPATWDQLLDLIIALPDRANTVLEMAIAADPQTPIAQFRETQTKAEIRGRDLVRRFGLAYLSDTGDARAEEKALLRDAPATAPAAPRVGRLDFRAVVNRGRDEPAVSQKDAQLLIADLSEHGPDAIRKQRADMAWFPLDASMAKDAQAQGLPIAGQWKGRWYVLASADPKHTMLADEGGKRAWGIVRAFVDKNEMGTPAVGFEFDQSGAQRFSVFTGAHVKRMIACLVNDEVVSAATVQSVIGSSGVIPTMNMTERAASDLAASLQRGMPPVTPPVPKPTGWEAFAAEVEVVIPAALGDPKTPQLRLSDGKLVAPPADANQWQRPAEWNEWVKAQHIDLMAANDATFKGLMGYDMAVAPIGTKLHSGVNWSQSLNDMRAMMKPGTSALLSAAGDLPTHYAIQTRDGSMGILTIVELTDNPKGVKIRYRLLKTPATQP